MAFACSMVSWVWLCAETARIWLRNCWSYSASEICVPPTSAITVSPPPRKMSATPHRAKASTRTPIMTEATQDLEAERSCCSMAEPNGLEGPRMIGRGRGCGKTFSKWELSSRVSSMRMLLAGNWKMNGLRAALAEIRALKRGLAETPPRGDILVCPPATLIAEAAQAAEGGPVAIRGQDCHPRPSGQLTGGISAEMLRDAGAT